MTRNALYIFLSLLLATALAAFAQSPTSSNPGGSETKDPYGATLDHPNPGSTQGATGQSYNANKVNEGQTPASTAPSTASSTPSTDTSSSSTSGTMTDTNTNNTNTSTNTATGSSLPRTASDLPLLATIGLLALGGALTVRSIAKRNT